MAPRPAGPEGASAPVEERLSPAKSSPPNLPFLRGGNVGVYLLTTKNYQLKNKHQATGILPLERGGGGGDDQIAGIRKEAGQIISTQPVNCEL
jgi:hypothetical protein